MFEPAPQDLVLTILGAHVGPREGTSVWSGGLVALLGEFGFTEGAARVALTRLVRRDLLERAKDGRMVFYTVTPRAAAVLAEGDRRIFGLGRETPPGPWTILWHTIPESQRVSRARLVARLRFLGFGSVQDGTWLAPHDRTAEVAALLDQLGVSAHAGVMVGEPAQVPDFAAFVPRVWDLDALAARYESFVADFSDATAAVQADDPRSAFQLRVRLMHTYRQFALLDPELPADLVAPPPCRAAAVTLFHHAYPALAPQAQRHFNGVMTP